MKVNMEKITDLAIQHHRNGVSGRPFFGFQFNYDDGEGSRVRHMHAVMPSDDNAKPSECYVIDLNDPQECWRGDNFYNMIKAEIRRMIDDVPVEIQRRFAIEKTQARSPRRLTTN